MLIYRIILTDDGGVSLRFRFYSLKPDEKMEQDCKCRPNLNSLESDKNDMKMLQTNAVMIETDKNSIHIK